MQLLLPLRLHLQLRWLAQSMPAIFAHLPPFFSLPHSLPIEISSLPAPSLLQSEYPPECHARRAFISNFDGSAGTVVVTADAAALWTDGRYFLQAGQQLGPAWTLMRQGTPTCPEVCAPPCGCRHWNGCGWGEVVHQDLLRLGRVG